MPMAGDTWQSFNWVFQPGPVTFDTNTQDPPIE